MPAKPLAVSSCTCLRVTSSITGSPGTASVIAQAIDDSNLTEQEGTLAGDNTLLVLFADEARLERWRERFEAIRAEAARPVAAERNEEMVTG